MRGWDISAVPAMSSDAAGEEFRSCGTAPCVLARAASGLKVMGVVNRIGGEVNRIGGEVNRIGVPQVDLEKSIRY